MYIILKDLYPYKPHSWVSLMMV